VENATGYIVTDAVTISGLTVQSQSFLLCDSYTSAFDLMPIDGVLGLPPVDFSHLSSKAFNSTPFFWRLVESKQLDPVFSFLLKSRDGNPSHGGELTLGGINQSLYEGEITYVSLNATGVQRTGEWFTDMPALYINGTPVSLNGTALPLGAALLDTGTAFIEVPDKATAAAIHAQISSNIRQIDPNGAWGAPCDVLSKLNPELMFTLGQGANAVNLTVDKDSFNLGPYPGQNGMCQTVFLNPSTPETRLPVWTIGSPLLKNYYTVWDGGNLRFGFAKVKNILGLGSCSG
jgi:hypothetical protein